MRIRRHITMLAATTVAIAALTPAPGALGAPNRAGSALTAQPVSASTRTYSTAARFVPERIWQELNDAIAVKLLNRS